MYLCLFLATVQLACPFAFNKTGSTHVQAEIEKEYVSAPLQIAGKIPDWLTGTLVRNGPIKVSINGVSNVHWFDGPAMLHAFSIEKGSVHYTNEFLYSHVYKQVFEKGKLNYEGFAQDPCRSLFKRYFNFFFPEKGIIQNANVNVAKFADRYVALTEVPLPVSFDLKTLKTLGVFDYQDALPKVDTWESAHPHHNSHEEAIYNYLIEYGAKSSYTLYRLENSTREVIGKVEVEEPSYMHSFSVTQNYIILTEYPLRVKPWDLVVSGKPFIKNFTWQPEKGTVFTIVSKKTGQVVKRLTTKPFFSFHHANAYEDAEKIVLDMVTYENADIITGESLYLNAHEAIDTPSNLTRFTIAGETIISETILNKPCEFPRINEAHDGLPYRFVYLTSINEESVDVDTLVHGEALYKIDMATKEAKNWSEKGCSPGEPVFVPSPNSSGEDEGLILCVVIDKVKSDSFLLILDAKNFTEIARAQAPHLIPSGFHGQFFSN